MHFVTLYRKCLSSFVMKPERKFFKGLWQEFVFSGGIDQI